MITCGNQIYYHFLVMSPFEKYQVHGSIMAACLRTVKQNQASFLKNLSLVYIHCMSKDDFQIGLAHFSCVKLICREIHLSFIDKMNERRVALMPVVVDGRKIDDIFKDVKSLALIRILSSCDAEERKELLVCIYLPTTEKYGVGLDKSGCSLYCVQFAESQSLKQTYMKPYIQ